jgi:uncharacterized protein YuzB (UPF0349 family)
MRALQSQCLQARPMCTKVLHSYVSSDVLANESKCLQPQQMCTKVLHSYVSSDVLANESTAEQVFATAADVHQVLHL